MNIVALIVDDEGLARARLRKLLAQEPGLEIAGECSNGVEAIEAIRAQRPDLVFLDVQMPEVSGFDVLRALAPEALPEVIFVTAHDQHAIAAFEVHALDYLLKPFTQARLSEAIRRARQHLQARDVETINRHLLELLNPAKPSSQYLNRFVVKAGHQTLFVRVEDVDYIEAASNYAILHTQAENHILRETLTNLESRLSPRMFLRISRSVMVNLERVKGLQSTPRGEYFVLLRNNRQLLMTRGTKEVQERLQ
jgi:two-component system, LytTR family, response regulator